MFKQILLWLFITGIGGAIIYFSQALSDNFGRIERFEKNLWSSRNGYIIVWFSTMIIGMLVLFGVIPTTSPIDNNMWWFSNQTQ